MQRDVCGIEIPLIRNRTTIVTLGACDAVSKYVFLDYILYLHICQLNSMLYTRSVNSQSQFMLIDIFLKCKTSNMNYHACTFILEIRIRRKYMNERMWITYLIV